MMRRAAQENMNCGGISQSACCNYFLDAQIMTRMIRVEINCLNDDD